ncbi:MAG TPA: response regulator transcription factor [Bacteroidales bacterium]|nr:response regulator transcription factor [Bacteroidales bacterium]HQH18959.1 response regulator transcription factor [Bacteroidales bacterium]
MENKEFRILLVDDEPDILEFLGYNLTKEGYTIYKASNGKEAIQTALNVKPHLIILDVMMPEMDGIETCREMKQIPSLNKSIIIFLTARAEDYSQIAGFDAGADDYIAKPIKPRVFISRVKAILRRFIVPEEKNTQIVLDEITINRDQYMVTKNNEKIILPKKEFELLWLLASKPNKVFTREEIYASIWGNVIVGDRTIDVHVRKIREKLDMDHIKTIKGIGYKFESK